MRLRVHQGICIAAAAFVLLQATVGARRSVADHGARQSAFLGQPGRVFAQGRKSRVRGRDGTSQAPRSSSSTFMVANKEVLNTQRGAVNNVVPLIPKTTGTADMHAWLNDTEFGYVAAELAAGAGLPEFSLETPPPPATTTASPGDKIGAGAGASPPPWAARLGSTIARALARGHASVAAPPAAAAEAAEAAAAAEVSDPPSVERSDTFLVAAVAHVAEQVGRREAMVAAAKRAKGAGAGTANERAGPRRMDPSRVPNLWLAVAHSDDLKTGQTRKVEVDGVPVALWRTPMGEVQAISDVCIHRGASLAHGWTSHGRLVCPYHGFEFEGDGTLAHMPGVTNAARAPPVAGTGKAGGGGGGGCGARKAPSYLVREEAGWVYLFPDAGRPGAVEQFSTPLSIPEASSPHFRYVGGEVEIGGHVDACVENMLDLLHISYVHTFGNINNPVPFEVSYETHGLDEPGSEASATSKVTFRYKSGPKAFSKVVGRSEEVVVTNEFHLPYRAVIRVYFGKDCLKTIEATAVPVGEKRTRLLWKLHRNFMLTHPRDEGPLNKAGDALFRKMMEVTLQEDKDIIENVYPEYQRGFMNAKFDKQVLYYRKALQSFVDVSAARTSAQVEDSLQMELLRRISDSRRGQATSPADRTAIRDLIERLEASSSPSPSSSSPSSSSTSSSSSSAAAAASSAPFSSPFSSPHASSTGVPTVAKSSAVAGQGGPGVVAGGRGDARKAKGGAGMAKAVNGPGEETPSWVSEMMEGQWHLEYISNDQEGWVYGGKDDQETRRKVDALREAGGEAHLLDWNERGRPLWADTAESVQIIDTARRIISNRAVYEGWSGLKTTVQLDAIFKPLEEKANRLKIEFQKAIVDIGGMRLTFPHLGRFSPAGWLETTYVNEHMRIARGNKGSVFVLTRKPLSAGHGGSTLFTEDGGDNASSASKTSASTPSPAVGSP